MATRKPAINPVEQDLPQDDDITVMPPDVALMTLLEELGENPDRVKIQVYKREVVNGIKKEAWLFDCTPSEFSFSDIQEFYNAGEYRIRVTGPINDGTNYVGMLSNKIHIIGEPRGGAKKAEIAQPQNNMAETIANAIKPILDQQAAQQKFMFDMLLAMNSNKGNQLEDFGKFAQALGALPQQNQQNPMDMIKAVVEINGMLQSDRDPMDKGVNATGMDVFLKMIDRFGPLFAQSMGTSNAIPMQGEQALLGNNPQPVQSSQPMQTPQQSIEEQAMLKLKMGLNFLVMQAEAGNDPVTYAGVTIDNVPTETLQQIIHSPTWLDFLAKHEQKVLQHPAWFEEYRKAIIAELADMTGESTETPPVESPPQLDNPKADSKTVA